MKKTGTLRTALAQKRHCHDLTCFWARVLPSRCEWSQIYARRVMRFTTIIPGSSRTTVTESPDSSSASMAVLILACYRWLVLKRSGWDGLKQGCGCTYLGWVVVDDEEFFLALVDRTDDARLGLQLGQCRGEVAIASTRHGRHTYKKARS